MKSAVEAIPEGASQRELDLREWLATVILESQRKMPHASVALIGEIIAIHARLHAYDGVRTKINTERDLERYLHAFEVLENRIKTVLADFTGSKDGQVLTKELADIHGEYEKLR
jgi:hypothetical protein